MHACLRTKAQRSHNGQGSTPCARLFASQLLLAAMQRNNTGPVHSLSKFAYCSRPTVSFTKRCLVRCRAAKADDIHLQHPGVRKACEVVEKGSARHASKLRAALLSYIKKGGYFTCSLILTEPHTALRAALLNLRMQEKSRNKEWWTPARGVTDLCNATLIIIGMTDTYSGWHVDWSQAANVNFSLKGSEVCCCIYLAQDHLFMLTYLL